jgi:cytochrome oxidase Cu insertion factor (SCO1/SenC/PrrC family)
MFKNFKGRTVTVTEVGTPEYLHSRKKIMQTYNLLLFLCMLAVVTSFTTRAHSIQRRLISMQASTLFDFDVESVDKSKVSLSSFKGKAKAFLLVNLASR